VSEELPQDLSPQQCELLASKVMKVMAMKQGCAVADLNTDIKAHPVLLHSLLRAAYVLGGLAADERRGTAPGGA